MPPEVNLPVNTSPERTNQPPDEDVWEHVAGMDEFKLLLIAKAEFVIPAVIIFVVYYFLLPISVGYFPQLMDKRVGPVNLAYLFALSQFFVAWLIAGLYVRGARKFDDYGARIMEHLDRRDAERLKGGK
jgi:uncharacterized membrane protein (DUF485 family)